MCKGRCRASGGGIVRKRLVAGFRLKSLKEFMHYRPSVSKRTGGAYSDTGSAGLESKGFVRAGRALDGKGRDCYNADSSLYSGPPFSNAADA